LCHTEKLIQMSWESMAFNYISMWSVLPSNGDKRLMVSTE